MTNIRSIDMLAIDDLFEMSGGYVLNFSDRTFAQFFLEELNMDIDNPIYAKNGTSKAKRLRCFLQTVDKPTVVRTLNALWEYREAVRQRTELEDKPNDARGRLLAIINRLGLGSAGPSQARVQPNPAFEREVYRQLQADLLDLSNLEAQARGYGFESFLKTLFNKFGLEAR